MSLLSLTGALAGPLLGLNPVLQSLLKLVFLASAANAIGLLVLRRWFGEARTLAWAKNLTLLGITLMLTLVASEFALRLLSANITTTSDNSSYWAARWLREHVRVNRLGFRGREVTPQREDGTYRLAVIGDSYTYGQGVEEDARFTNVIERKLNRSTRRLEALNFGRPGAETVDEVGILTDIVLRLEPDFILLQWHINDVLGHDKSGLPRPLPLLPSAFLREWLHRHSTLYYMLNQQWNKLQAWRGWTPSYAEYMVKRFGDPASPYARAAEAQLGKFLAVARTRGIPVGVVLFPRTGGLGTGEYPFDFLHDRVLAWCQRERVDCLDLREALQHAAQQGDLHLNRFDGHPNADAHRIAAEEILRHFEGVWTRGPVASTRGKTGSP